MTLRRAEGGAADRGQKANRKRARLWSPSYIEPILKPILSLGQSSQPGLLLRLRVKGKEKEKETGREATPGWSGVRDEAEGEGRRLERALGGNSSEIEDWRE